uniref:Secreted protein n=1 Tax=Haptolina ericina TaxID=156174 RepID=A0A7S3BH62_9EUKA
MMGSLLLILLILRLVVLRRGLYCHAPQGLIACPVLHVVDWLEVEGDAVQNKSRCHPDDPNILPALPCPFLSGFQWLKAGVRDGMRERHQAAFGVGFECKGVGFLKRVV